MREREGGRSVLDLEWLRDSAPEHEGFVVRLPCHRGPVAVEPGDLDASQRAVLRCPACAQEWLLRIQTGETGKKR